MSAIGEEWSSFLRRPILAGFLALGSMVNRADSRTKQSLFPSPVLAAVSLGGACWCLSHAPGEWPDILVVVQNRQPQLTRRDCFEPANPSSGRARVSGVGVEDSGKPHERVERCIAADRCREWPVAGELELIGSTAFFLLDSAE